MQRRAAAVSVAFFLLVAAGAYAVLGVVAEPTVAVDADEELSAGQSLTLDGTEYTLASIDTQGAGPKATFEWTNESSRFTETFDNNTTITYQGSDYRVLIPNESDPTGFAVAEVQNVEAILANDTAVENGTVTRADGREYVVYAENGSTALLSEYLPPQDTQQFSEGDDFDYENQTATVGDVATGQVAITWTASEDLTASASEGQNVTLGATNYLTHFPDNSTVQLSTDHAGYEGELARIDYYHERRAGLWGVVLLNSLAAILLVGFSYLPSRY